MLVVGGIIVANFRDRLLEFFFANQLRDSGDLEGFVSEQDMFDFLEKQGLLIAALGAAIVVILLIVLFSWVAWRFHTYRISDEAVEARSGVVFRNHRRAPLERIQSVNLQRPLLARVLGLTKIEVLTAGQGGKVELAYLGHRDAKTVREQILQRAALKRDGVAPLNAQAVQVPPVVGYDGYVYGAASDNLTERAQTFADSDVDPEAFAANTLVRVPVGRLIGSIALGWEAVIAVAIVVAIVVLGATLELAILVGIIPMVIVVFGIVFSQFNKGFNFTLSRSSDAVRTGAGLTATATETIPFGRIHAIEARQPLLWRPAKWWKVRITLAGHSVAQGGQNATQNVVLPVGFEDDVLRVIDTLLPGVGDDAVEIEALREALTGSGRGYLGAGPRAGWVLWWGRKRAGMRVDGLETGDNLGNSTLRIRRGALTRSLSIMPIVRSQSIQLRRPLVHRMLGLASVQAHTVLGPVRMEMRGLALKDASVAFDFLAETVLRVQGAEAAERAERKQGVRFEQSVQPTQELQAAQDAPLANTPHPNEENGDPQ
ncbi:PH domain-containing protein [Leucobacter coleopterorum]|uniref:PH domain-containing protein n=2 Tax=Leucobacter coleopterorum TaxID=2714933 RepID=A0ABX6K3P7_9MICO|nr:PH domain-containing protein [Leucobacter coleopterorum]